MYELDGEDAKQRLEGAAQSKNQNATATATASNGQGMKVNMSTKPKRPSTAAIRQPQINQKVNRQNQTRETYQSQHVMPGDYEKAKKEAFDDNLVLAGNTKSISSVLQSAGAFNAQLVRK